MSNMLDNNFGERGWTSINVDKDLGVDKDSGADKDLGAVTKFYVVWE